MAAVDINIYIITKQATTLHVTIHAGMAIQLRLGLLLLI